MQLREFLRCLPVVSKPTSEIFLKLLFQFRKALSRDQNHHRISFIIVKFLTLVLSTRVCWCLTLQQNKNKTRKMLNCIINNKRVIFLRQTTSLCNQWASVHVILEYQKKKKNDGLISVASPRWIFRGVCNYIHSEESQKKTNKNPG